MSVIGVTKRKVGEIIDTVTPTNPDTIVDSCSDSSEVDEPKPIRSSSKPLSHVQHDYNIPTTPTVEKSLTYGGRTKYMVTKPDGEAYYFVVQW